MLPILYSFRRCPYAMRARLALAVSGQVCALREVKLRDKPADLLAVSPKGTVPVLVLQDDRAIDESLDIMRWALDRHDPESWLPASLPSALALIAQCDGPFKQQLDRYKYPNRYSLDNGLAARAAAEPMLLAWQQILSGQPFLHGPHFGLADAAIAPFVRQFAHTDAAWFAAQPWPQLQAWLAHFEASERFAAVMRPYEVWTKGQAIQAFPPTAAPGQNPGP